MPGGNNGIGPTQRLPGAAGPSGTPAAAANGSDATPGESAAAAESFAKMNALSVAMQFGGQVGQMLSPAVTGSQAAADIAKL